MADTPLTSGCRRDHARRWPVPVRARRPLAPVVFGVEDSTVPIMKGAIEAVVALAGHAIVETDPELGANLMIFFIRDWSELMRHAGA
jgi:hypothetical protein